MAALRTEAGSEAGEGVAARTGEQFLAGLARGGREIWLNGEKITHPLEHRELEAAARSMARVFDVQHEHAEEMLARSPDDGRLVNVTHLIPRSREDLERRRRAIELTASFSAGTMGRTPDYLNVTFACFAGRSDVWARRGNELGAENLVAYQRHMRDADLSTTHALINPQVDRSKPEAEQAAGEISLHKIGETEDSIVVRGGRMLATLAPFADDLLIYPGSDIRPQDGRYALSFAVPIATPGLKFICRDSYSKQRPAYDYPLSSRFDEMDCVVIFDDVEVPKDRVFLDGDTVGYSEVISDTGWRGHIMHQAFTRAYVKLCFAFGLGHVIANTIGVVRFDDARRRHPVQRFVATRIVMDEDGPVGLEDEQADRFGQRGGQPTRVVDFAAGDDEAHGTPTVLSVSDMAYGRVSAACTRAGARRRRRCRRFVRSRTARRTRPGCPRPARSSSS